ncbi:MAG TPA: universal stress protein [Methylomirabilota bacterium]|nr:universal stress protein [Methylomirabilota bacterium]
MRRIRRIVHATDFSRASAPAFRAAIEWARSHGARLHLLHVLVPASPFLVGDERLPPSYLELQAQSRRAAQRRMAATLRRAQDAGVRAQAALVEGLPADRILRFAQARRADLVVIGTHGRTGLGKLFMGSVAERVLRRARCPVLTVRGR